MLRGDVRWRFGEGRGEERKGEEGAGAGFLCFCALSLRRERRRNEGLLELSLFCFFILSFFQVFNKYTTPISHCSNIQIFINQDFLYFSFLVRG